MGQNSNIQEVIKHLLDQENPFPATMLYQLSDLSREDCRDLRGVWNNLPLTRRRSLMEDLVNLSESDYLLMFEEVGKIALDDPDPEVLISAIDLLFQAEDEHLVPVFLKLLQQPQQNDRVRAAAANALGPYVFLGEIEELQFELLRTIEDALLKAYTEDASDLVRRRALRRRRRLCEPQARRHHPNMDAVPGRAPGFAPDHAQAGIRPEGRPSRIRDQALEAAHQGPRASCALPGH